MGRFYSMVSPTKYNLPASTSMMSSEPELQELWCWCDHWCWALHEQSSAWCSVVVHHDVSIFCKKRLLWWNVIENFLFSLLAHCFPGCQLAFVVCLLDFLVFSSLYILDINFLPRCMIWAPSLYSVWFVFTPIFPFLQNPYRRLLVLWGFICQFLDFIPDNEVLIRKLFPIPLSSRVPPLFFLAQLHHFRFYTVVFDPFGVDIWCRGIDVDLISFFCRWTSSFPCPISITLSLSFSVYFWHFCQITDGCS